jgi:hypothetical protein
VKKSISTSTASTSVRSYADRINAHRLALDGETLRKPPEKSAKRGKLDTDTAE